jgi:hypothetical protein
MMAFVQFNPEYGKLQTLLLTKIFMKTNVSTYVEYSINAFIS